MVYNAFHFEDIGR